MFKLLVEGIDPTELITFIKTNKEINLYVGIHPSKEGLLPPSEMHEIFISIVGAAGWFAIQQLFQFFKNRGAELNILDSDSDELIHCKIKYDKYANYHLKSVKKDKDTAEYVFETDEKVLLKIKITKDFQIIEEEKAIA